ncbi:MAG: hypothetical protein JSV63_00625 [Candidatus Aenigmatarchaeota archaeon]|nr:MAG: hypothetical protein JSV63_00625 [Candidatus Aenigmarchaeota archaeon]
MAATKTGKSLAILLILPAVVLLTSGCTDFLGGGAGPSGNGIVITSFQSDLTEVESEEDVGLHLEVQNQGDVIGYAAAQLINIDPTAWGGFAFADYDIGELLPADKEAGTLGQTGRADWMLVSPVLNRGDRRTYKPMVRMFYEYETRIIKPITFLTSEETRRAVQAGEALPSEPAIVSAGPLSVNVRTGEFVRTRDDWQMSYFPVEITIQNTGGGLIAGRNYPIGIDVEAPAGTAFRGGICPRESQLEYPAFDMNLPAGITFPPALNTINMWNGRDITITCELNVINPPQFRDTRDLKVTLSYVYYQDAELQLNVVGTREF